jgi:hypothetical protein
MKLTVGTCYFRVARLELKRTYTDISTVKHLYAVSVILCNHEAYEEETADYDNIEGILVRLYKDHEPKEHLMHCTIRLVKKYN